MLGFLVVLVFLVLPHGALSEGLTFLVQLILLLTHHVRTLVIMMNFDDDDELIKPRLRVSRVDSRLGVRASKKS